VLRDFKDIFIMGIVVNELIKSGKNIPYEWNIRIHIEVLSNNLFKHDQTDRMNQLSHLKLNEIFNIWETGIVSESLWDDYE
jgi:predicted HTH domain antitoxin